MIKINNRRSFSSVVMVILVIFLFNIFSDYSINFLQSHQPPTYLIPTNNFNRLMTYLMTYWGNYAITGVGYLFLWGLYVALLLSSLLWFWNKFSWTNLLSGLKTGRVHLYSVVILLMTLPLNQFGFKFPLSYYLTIPKTFLDMVLANVWVPWIGWAIYLLIILLLMKSRYFIYQVVISRDHIMASFKNSWQRGHLKIRLFLSLLEVIGILIMSLLVIIYMQKVCDVIAPVTIRRLTANILVVVMTGIFYWLTAYLIAVFCQAATPESLNNDSANQPLLINVVSLVVLVVVSISSVTFSGKLMGLPNQKYLVIAHKGVSHLHATANVIGNLKKVSQAQPDYIEIDIQRTVDGVYVLSHDSKVTDKGGKRFTIKETKWSVLKQLTLVDGKKDFNLSTFDEYLRLANHYHQKLLVELKISDTITNQQLKAFTTKYKTRLKENHAEIQSLNQNALKRVSKYIKIRTGLLSPVKNTIDSAKNNDFYSIEYSNVNTTMVREIDKQNKDLYIWTVNRPEDVASGYVLGVRGFITDYPKRVRSQLQQIKGQPTYSEALEGVILFQKSGV